jgi:hypothetical protein
MDSGGAGGIFSHAHFMPPFVPPFRCCRGKVHWRAGQRDHERGYDELRKAGEREKRRIRLRFQTFGPVERNSCMRNYTHRVFLKVMLYKSSVGV